MSERAPKEVAEDHEDVGEEVSAGEDEEDADQVAAAAAGAGISAATASAATVGGTAEPNERYLRLAADFENFRRRKAQELADRSRYASEDAAKALIPVLDNLRRAVGHAAEEGPPDLIAGLELTVREFEAALDRLGITEIDAEGRPFDTSVHEAIGGEESDAVDVDTVSMVVQRGYRLHDRVLRPALVRVAHPAGRA